MEESHKELHGGDKGPRVQVAPGKVSYWYKQDIFYSESNYSLEQAPQERGRTSIAGGFQEAIGQAAT